MKILYKKCLVAITAIAFLGSCADDDTLSDVRGQKATVTLNTVTGQAAEGEEITFTLTVDTPQGTDMDFKLELVDEGSTASFRDFTTSGEETDISGGGGYGQGKIGYSLVFPAYAKTFSFTVTPTDDFEFEGTEVIKLLLRSSGNSKGLVAEGSKYITINVTDNASGNIGMELKWDGNGPDAFGTIQEGSYLLPDGTSAAFSDYDFDLYVFDENFNPVDNNQAATGNSPESLTLLSSDLLDGEYIIAVELYEAGPAPATPFNFDMSLTVTKFGTWGKKIPLAYTSEAAEQTLVTAILTKTGTTYTLADADGQVLASGRQSAGFNTQLKNAISKAKLKK